MAANLSDLRIYFKINDVIVTESDSIVANGQYIGTEVGVKLGLYFEGVPLDGFTIECNVIDSDGKSVNINYNEEEKYGVFKFNGDYTVQVTVFDPSDKDNYVTDKLTNLMIRGCYTTLKAFEPLIIDDAHEGVPITNNYTVNDNLGVCPNLDQELPVDLTVESYVLSRNGLVLAYTPASSDRTVYDDGEYTLTITIRRKGSEVSGDIMVKSFTRTFTIKKSQIYIIRDNNIFIYNQFNNIAINNGATYIEKDIVLNWDLDQELEEVSTTLTFYAEADGIIGQTVDDYGRINDINVSSDFPPIVLGDFEKGGTVLSKYGVYKLQIILKCYNDERTKVTLCRWFKIKRKDIEIFPDFINCYYYDNDNNLQVIDKSKDNYGNFLTTDKIVPYFSYDIDEGDRVQMTISYTYDGKYYDNTNSIQEDDFVFQNGVTVLDKQGVYDFNIKVKDIEYRETSGDTDSTKMKIKNFRFTIVEPPKSFKDVNVILKDITTNKEVENGYTFENVNEGFYEFAIDKIDTTKVQFACRWISAENKEYVSTTELGGFIEKNADFNNGIYAEMMSTSDISKIKASGDESSLSYLKIPKDQAGSYLVMLKIEDDTLGVNGERLYPYNIYYKTYTFNIARKLLTDDNDPDKMTYINGQLLDPERKNAIWAILSDDSSELDFQITKPGNYNIVVVNKNKYNFNYSINEYNVTVVDPSMQQLPTITTDPAPSSVAYKTYKVYITYPSVAIENSKMYRLVNKLDDTDDSGWLYYPDNDLGLELDKEYYIYAKYQDYTNSDWVETFASYASPTIVDTEIDFDDSKLINLVSGKRYYSVTLDVKRTMNYEYTARILKYTPKNQDDANYVSIGVNPLGTVLKYEGNYTIQVTAVNTLNGDTGSTSEINFTIDHTLPQKCTISGISNNGETTGQVNLTLGNTNYTKYLYEVYSNNRLLAKTNSQSTNIKIPPIIRNGHYNITAVAIDKETNQRSMTYLDFTISNNKITLAGTPKVKPLKYVLKADGTYAFYNNLSPYDGELLTECKDTSSWTPTGRFGIYRDGLVLNKLDELSKEIIQLSNAVGDIEVDITMNDTITQGLSSLKKELYYSLVRLLIENNALSATVSQLYDYMIDATVPPMDPAVEQRMENNSSYKLAKTNSQTLTNLSDKQLVNTVKRFESLIESLLQNSNSIGELSHLAAVYRASCRIYD